MVPFILESGLQKVSLKCFLFCKKKGIHIFYFTNNSSKTKNQIYKKLTRLGLSVDLNDVYNSAYAASIYAKTHNFKKIFCCGTLDLREQFLSEGLQINTSGESVDAIFIGLDTLFDYEKLSEVLAVIRNSKCPLIACNIDKNYPIENGVLMPGCGSIVAAIENCCEREVDFIIGKPNSYMLELLMKDHDIKKEEILVVGDSYTSDIAMAKNVGCKSVLIAADDVDDLDVNTVRLIKDLIPLLEVNKK